MTKKLMLKQLASMLASFKRKKKYYCEVEYLENTGITSNRNWINTTIVPDNNTKWEVRLSFDDTTTGKLMGSGYATPTRFNLGIESSRFRFAFNAWFDANQDIVTPDTNIHTWTIDAPIKTFTIDGYSITTTQNFGETTFPITLFGRCNSGNGSTETSNALTGKIYYTKIWQNNVLVRDMIPVLDWNYVPCMYDKVSGELFYNQGTGSFTYGREIHYVNYLESTGTQYIDTGYVLSSDCRGEALAEYTGVPSSGSSYIFGTYGSGKNFGVNTSLHSPGQDTFFYFVWANVARVDVTGDPLPALNTKYHVLVSRTLFKVNNSEYTYNGDTFTGSNSAYLFWANGTSQPKSTMKLYWTKFWDGSGNLVRDYIPAIDENGVGFMFDKVTHNIFDNAGTDSFKYPAREVEYLESSGTQYIDTGITTWNNTIEYEIKLGVRQQSGTRTYFGCYDTWNAGGKIVPAINTYVQSYKMQSNFDTGFLATSGTAIGIENNQTGIIELKENVLSWSEGSAIAFDRGEEFTKTNLPIYLFGTYYGGAPKELASFPLHYAKIWLDGTLIRDYIPVYQNGVAGLLDKANNVFYTNGGTGTFTAGKIKESEYLE